MLAAVQKTPRPTFHDAYLVADPGGQLVGVVRRDRHVWRIFLLGAVPPRQPAEVFATREEAGVRLLELAARAQPG